MPICFFDVIHIFKNVMNYMILNLITNTDFIEPYCPKEKGYCKTDDNWDQDFGVKKLYERKIKGKILLFFV